MEPSTFGIALPLTARASSTSDLIEELIEEVVAAEASGFGLCLIPEHRQGPEIGTGAPLPLAAAICARTSTIQVATGVLIATPHHPVHLAEQVAAIDNLSRGRFVLGLGVGYQEADLQPFGVERSSRVQRFEHVVQSVRALLTEEPAGSVEAQAIADSTIVRPRPTHRVPFWIGAWSQSGVERAARIADGWIADPIRTVDEVAVMADRYRSACEDAGKPGTVVVMREAWVDADDAAAATNFAPVIEPIYRYYRRNGAFTEGSEDGSDVRFGDLAASRLVVGSAATCIGRAAEIVEATGADHLVLHLRHPGGPSHDDTVRAIRGLAAAM